MQPWHSPYVYGFHEPPDPGVLPHGWLVHLVEVGDNPEPHPGVDYTQWSGYGNICRMQYSWGGGGTYPLSDKLDAYLERVRTLVLNSRGCHIWIPGNEPNHINEVPAGSGMNGYNAVYVARIYDAVRSIVHALPGHEQDEVLLPPIAPWTDQIGIGWIEYFQLMIQLCRGPIDGFALHTYSRGANPASITDQSKMESYPQYYNGWPTIYDWLDAIPERYKRLPVYLTETNQNQPWSEDNTGWVQAMYRELNRHNESGGQIVRCGVLYRWPHYDQYGIEGNAAIISDFHTAQSHEYKWTENEPEPPPEEDTMLLNPSFEEGWYDQEGGILILPEHWAAEFMAGGDPWFRPEIKPNEEFVTDGRFSIRAFPPEHSRGFFGIYQERDAEPGQWYRFSADVRINSNPSGDLAAFVGIQPWGASMFERQMIWGKETLINDQWQRIEVIAQAFGGRIRVVMGATNKWATRNNTVWWDNALLELWECDGETEPPTEPPIEPPQPGECLYDEDRLIERVASVVRYELDHTRLAPNE